MPETRETVLPVSFTEEQRRRLDAAAARVRPGLPTETWAREALLAAADATLPVTCTCGHWVTRHGPTSEGIPCSFPGCTCRMYASGA